MGWLGYGLVIVVMVVCIVLVVKYGQKKKG